MKDRADLLRVDVTGTLHPVGRIASQQMRARGGEWSILPSPKEVLVFRTVVEGGPVLRLAGEMRTPGALCDVVAMAAQAGWRGELVVMDDKGQRSFYFDAGLVVGASTTVPDERLGETLYRFGVVTREQLDMMIKSSETTGKRIGEAAIELEYVSAEDLYPMMARQVEEVFYAALHVSEGTFFFFDRFDEKNLLRRHNLNTGQLLMEGARRMDEMKYFREKVPNDGFIPVAISTNKNLPDELIEVYEQCDGKRDIAEIGRRTGMLEFEVTRAMFQLSNAGFVQMQAPRPQGPEAIVEVFNSAMVMIHEACDQAGKGSELRDGLGRFATGGGIYDPLFMMAGPAPNGTLKPERIAKNLAALAGTEPDAWLVQLLQEYVGFALFQCESLVNRDDISTLVNTVSEMLKPLRLLEPAPASTSINAPALVPRKAQ